MKIKAIILKKEKGIVIKKRSVKDKTFKYAGGRYRVNPDKVSLRKNLFWPGYTPYAIYIEGNPEPMDVYSKDTNLGIPAQVLNDLYSPRLFNILKRAESGENWVIILIVINIIITAIAVAAATGAIVV